MQEKKQTLVADTGFHERVKQLLDSSQKFKNQSDLARNIEVTQSTLNHVFKGGEPGLLMIRKLARAFDVSTDMLVFGVENENSEPRPLTTCRLAPITGLASCGEDGWSRLESTQFQAELPKSIEDDKDAFAVISRGESMQPFGIYEGYLCFCSPALEPKIGDIVCVERMGDDDEISLTIKKLGLIGHGAVEIIGYLPLKENPSSGLHSKQFQELFWETVPMKDIERLSVVTHIHTRPSSY